MTKKDKLALCKGCWDDYYNHNREGSCWGFADAKIVHRTSVGTWQEPPYRWHPQRTLHCHHPEGRHWIEKNDPRIEDQATKGTSALTIFGPGNPDHGAY